MTAYHRALVLQNQLGELYVLTSILSQVYCTALNSQPPLSTADLPFKTSDLAFIFYSQ